MIKPIPGLPNPAINEVFEMAALLEFRAAESVDEAIQRSKDDVVVVPNNDVMAIALALAKAILDGDIDVADADDEANVGDDGKRYAGQPRRPDGKFGTQDDTHHFYGAWNKGKGEGQSKLKDKVHGSKSPKPTQLDAAKTEGVVSKEVQAARERLDMKDWFVGSIGPYTKMREEAAKAYFSGQTETNTLAYLTTHDTLEYDSIYRGMRVSPDDLAKYAEGKTLDFPPSSFSIDESVSRWYAQNTGYGGVKNKSDVTVLFTVSKTGDEPIRGTDFVRYTTNKFVQIMGMGGGEVISGGRFRVTGAKQARGYYRVSLEQLAA